MRLPKGTLGVYTQFSLLVVRIGKDISNLRNLKTLRISVPQLDHDQCDIVQRFLTFLDASGLQSMTVILTEQEPVKDTRMIDEYLAGDKFKDLHEFRIETVENTTYNSWKLVEDAVQALFFR